MRLISKLYLIIFVWLLSYSFSEADMAIVTVKANIRNGPGKGYKVIHVLSKNSVVQISEKSKQWYKILASGKGGWIYHKLVKKLDKTDLYKDTVILRSGDKITGKINKEVPRIILIDINDNKKVIKRYLASELIYKHPSGLLKSVTIDDKPPFFISISNNIKKLHLYVFLIIFLSSIVLMISIYVIKRKKWESKIRPSEKKRKKPRFLNRINLTFDILINELEKAVNKIKYCDLKEINDHLNILKDTYKSPLLVTVLGEFSSGKSSFINALLKDKLLAMKIRPTTATITLLHYGHKKNLEIHYNNGKMVNRDISNLHKLTVENFVKEANILDDIYYVRAEIENDFLNIIDMADTPGFNSNLERHSEITANFISHSDVIFWIFDANQLEKKSTFELIEKHCRNYRPIGIINKIDQLDTDSDDPEESPERIVNELSRKLDNHVEKVFPVSSKHALSEDEGLYKSSGIQNILTYFDKNIIPNATITKKKMTFIKLAQIACDLDEARSAIVKKVKSFDNKTQQFNKESKELEARQTNFNKSVENYNRDISNSDITAADMLANIKIYLIGRKVPETITIIVNKMSTRNKELESDNSRLEEWINNIEEKRATIDAEFEVLNKRWEEYDNKLLGLKRVFDDFVGSVTDERKKFNKDSDVWDKKCSKFNKDIEAYNEFLNKTNKNWERFSNSFTDFLNNSLAIKINEEIAVLKKDIDRLSKNEDELKNEMAVYNKMKKDLNIFDNNIFEIFQAMHTLYVDLQATKSENVFTDFEEMISQFKKYEEKEKVFSGKSLYSRSNIKKIIHLDREKTFGSGNQYGQLELEGKVAPKLK